MLSGASLFYCSHMIKCKSVSNYSSIINTHTQIIRIFAHRFIKYAIMKKFVKGVRFAPKNYSDEVEAKIQHYKREGYKYRQDIYCVQKNNWQAYAKAQG